MKKAIYIAVVVILLLVFGVSAFFVGSYLLEGKKQAARYDELAQSVKDAQATAPSTEAPAEQATDPTETVETEPTEPQMLPGYAELWELNNDLVGWLRIEDTVIDYPVMHTPDAPNFYLDKDFDKNNSARGALYIREECDVFEPSDNVTIFGHTMMDGSMFAYLHNYVEPFIWEENPLIFFDTLYEYHVYKIFAVFKTTANLGEGFAYHQMEYAESEEDFNEFIATCKDLAFYDTGITPEYGDKVICLSTCEYSQENGRLVVAAVRIS